MEDEHQHYVGKVTHKALIERGGKVLIARGKNHSKWDIPGGRIHSGETPAQAVAREVKEELGLDLIVGPPFYADLVKLEKSLGDSSNEERYFLWFRTTLVDSAQEPTFPSDEAVEVMWIGPTDVETVPLYDTCLRALRSYFGPQG